MKKKKSGCFVAISLSILMAFSLTACGGGNTEQQSAGAASSGEQEESVSSVEPSSNEQSASEEASAESTADEIAAASISEEESTESASSDPETVVQSALQTVADMNGCEVADLIVNYDDYGYVNFLGDAYTDEKILSADDAWNSLGYLVDLTGLDQDGDGISDSEFIYYREDVSPVSGYTYYTFTQVASGTTEEMPITYSNSQIRVIADADGNSAGFSADITNPDSIQQISEENMVEQTEAEELVKAELEEESSIINDLTQLTYWDDENTARNTSTGKVIPAWLIYTNQSREGKPYTMYVVSAQRDDSGQAVISDRIALNALNIEDDTYTSKMFFEGMEDGGTYTYHVDMTWAYEADTGYQAEQELDITVPVMHDPETGLYYLADYNEQIAAANYYDFNRNNEVNALVSEDPNDINSWHFASMTGPNGEAYFCNVNYVIASFDTMLKAYNIYKDRYGYNSVDMSGIPILLLMNACDGDYPTDPSQFTENAFDMGQQHDWAVFSTSPTFTGCVEVGTMTHEFAHGINGQLTNAQYLNAMGAVMEGYADSIGENLALLYGYKDTSYAKVVGSQYAMVLRSFSDPYEFKNAKYIGGMYYVSPVSNYAPSGFDEGGVHLNSSIVNYLCYCLSNNEDSSKAVIDLGKNVDMFVETLYCATYNTGYDELGAYLLFAANFVDLTEEELQYVDETIYSLGFAGDGSELEQLIAEDGGYTYSITLENDENLIDVVTFETAFKNKDSGDIQIAGGTDEEGRTAVILPDDSAYDAYVYVTFLDSGETVGCFRADSISADTDISIPVSYYQVEVGETLTCENGIYYAVEYSYDTYSYGTLELEDGQTELTCNEEGIYCLSIVNDSGNQAFVIVETE